MTPQKNTSLAVEEAGELLKAAGMRRTIARILLLQCLANQMRPRTQAEIAEELAPHGFDSSTIFRGLTDLTDAGLVVRIEAGDRVWRFELHDRDRDGSFAVHHHSHIICQQCGKITCLELDAAMRLGNEVSDWCIDDMIIRGVCGDCQGS